MAIAIWRDLTDLLSLHESATIDEVKKAFRGFARNHHPDINPNSERQSEFLRASALIGLVNKGMLTPDTKAQIEFQEEEDPFADVATEKEKQANEAQPIYQPIVGITITIERTINAVLAEVGGKLIIPITGGALLASNLAREKEIEININPRSWGKHKIVLRGKGKPGLFGGKSGDLIVSISSNPLKPPTSIIRVETNGQKTPGLTYSTKTRPSQLPKPLVPPKPILQKSKRTEDLFEAGSNSWVFGGNKASQIREFRNFILILASLIAAFAFFSHNVDQSNSDDATMAICDSAGLLAYDITQIQYSNYQEPYKAAIYFNYFKADVDAKDNLAIIATQLLRIRAENYSKIKSLAGDLLSAASQDDGSIVTDAMSGVKAECITRQYGWTS